MPHKPYTAYTAYDAAFTVKADSWQPLQRGFLDAFGREGLDILNGRDREFRAEGRTVVFLTFENKFAPLGGLAAVMRLLPEYLKKAGENVVILTPLFANIPKVREAIDGGALELVVPEQKFCMSSYDGAFCCYRNVDAPLPAYYIGVRGRFTAALNPYSYDDSGEILDDALAFCAAVPHALKALGIDRDILVHSHDWETALAAVTTKVAVLGGLLSSARAVLTLHNSFDSGISAERRRLFFGNGAFGDTVLQCAIPLLNGPLTTVSTPFAYELRADALQRTVFTNHLQGAFAMNPPTGVENGMFGKPRLRYTYRALSWARQGRYDELLKEKARFREKMLNVVKSMSRLGVIGGLSDVTDDKPIFFMSGRLDLSQKGFDVIFQAIRGFPAGKAGLIFCPSSAEGEKSADALAFFREIAEERPGDVVVWPFRVSGEDYISAVEGSSFLLMPSFYEPFGAATEGLMHGTPVVARATGGLLVQVKPLGAVNIPRYYKTVFGWDGSEGSATGILYRERLYGDGGWDDGGHHSGNDSLECEGWKDILNSHVPDRIRVPLYRSMVDEALKALTKAAEVFADPDAYGRMALNGMDSLRSFSWDAAVEKYRRVYDIASRRGFFDS